MAYRLPSLEWIGALSDALNGSEAYRQAAKDWEGDFVFVIESDDEGGQPAYLYLDLYHGASRDYAELGAPDERQAAFTIAAPLAVWRRVVEGKLDPIKGIMMRQLRLQGDLMKVMRHPKAAREIIACCALVPTEF